jgi:hypothetical protein
MRITKLFLTSLLLCNLMTPAIAQQDSRGSRSKARNRAQSLNRPPIINLLAASSPTVIIPCPRWIAGAWVEQRLTLNLATDASDPDGDTLLYRYSVTGGKTIGEGSNVSWDLTSVASGSYEAAVTVSDQHGGATSSSIKVSALLPTCCLPPCAVVSVSCLDEVEEAQSVTFTANISGGEPTVEPFPNWSVSAGKIIKGQGTYTIEVDTTGLGGEHIEITFEVSGYLPECTNKASCMVQVKKR